MNGGSDKLHLLIRNVADHFIFGGEGAKGVHPQNRNGKCEVYSMMKIGGCNEVM